MSKIQIYLTDLGFGEIESKIYLNLLKNGPSTILEISRRTGINRITTHTNADILIKKGLVSNLKKGSRRYLIAEAPQKIEQIIKSQEIELNRKRNLFPSILNMLENEISSQKRKVNFDVRTYEGKMAIELLYDEILQSKELRAYVNAEKIHKLYPENFHKFGQKCEKGLIEIWDIVENNKYGALQQKINRYKNYHIKILPPKVTIGSMDYLIHDNKITIIDGEDNPVGVVITSESLYVNTRTIFDCLWDSLQ